MRSSIENPTPYDSGKRLEPKVWVDPRTALAGEELLRLATNDDYGRVDFDDECSQTRLTLWVENEGGRLHLHLETYNEAQVEIEVH